MSIRALENTWILETEHTAYVVGVNTAGALVQAYWGQRLPDPGDYPTPPDAIFHASFTGPGHMWPEEYAGLSGLKYVEPALKVTFADGVRDLVFQLVGGAVEGDTLVLTLRDAHYPLTVALHYRVHAAHDLIERRAVVRNDGAPLTIERAFSAQWQMPIGRAYRLSYLSGRWIDEFQLHRQPLTPGVFVRESRRLTTSHHASPWFALDDHATETHGEVWFGALAWSGNWKLAAEVTDFGRTRLSLGVNDWDFALRLGSGDSFTTPASLGGYTRAGFGAASRALHAYTRDCVLPHGRNPHKVLYNSWEATTFNVDVDSQSRLAELAAELGAELFVMDDGWFQGRNSDDAGLGDWWPDPKKFPDGLAPLIARVNALGMDFGLWLEPEMVSPNSDLYRAHPDWVIHFPTRARTESRNQLILNLARGDVQDYLIAVLDKLLGDHNITFIKWDMNRNVSEPGWPEAGDRQRELWVRYVEGLYRVWGTLRERHPNVVWQSCSGGGGRADLGILRLADQVWISDNTDALSRLHIQHGYSQMLPADTMEAWVTDVNAGRISLDFRFHVSMQGVLGIGGNLNHWTPAERSRAAKHVALYKEIRPIVQNGELYRLIGPNDGSPYVATQYVGADRRESVLFVFRRIGGGADAMLDGYHAIDPRQPAALQLQGLDPTARYKITGQGAARSGLAWMRAGLTVTLGHQESKVLRIKQVAG